MAGPVLHQGATVTCSHAGQAVPTAPSARVLVSGLAIVTLAAPYVVAACPFAAPGGNGPCVTSTWTGGALRVTSELFPVVIMTGMSVSAPTGTPLLPLNAQARVLAE